MIIEACQVVDADKAVDGIKSSGVFLPRAYGNITEDQSSEPT